MENNPKNNKAIGEREMIRQEFIRLANNPPIPNPFDAQSMTEWADYCETMRAFENTLAEM